LESVIPQRDPIARGCLPSDGEAIDVFNAQWPFQLNGPTNIENDRSWCGDVFKTCAQRAVPTIAKVSHMIDITATTARRKATIAFSARKRHRFRISA